LTNLTTTLGVCSLLKCRVIADWSIENTKPEMLKENEIFLDVNLSPKENLRKIKKQNKTKQKHIFFSKKQKQN
jgi:hypothetical protein